MYEQLALLFADRPDLARRKKTYAAYSADWPALAASAPGQAPLAPLNIQDGFDFVWCASTATVHDSTNANLIANNPFLVSISDTSSTMVVFDRPAAFNNVFGNAQNPMVLPYPRVILGNGGLLITLQNLIATVFDVRVTLHGFKLSAPV